MFVYQKGMFVIVSWRVLFAQESVFPKLLGMFFFSSLRGFTTYPPRKLTAGYRPKMDFAGGERWTKRL